MRIHDSAPEVRVRVASLMSRANRRSDAARGGKTNEKINSLAGAGNEKIKPELCSKREYFEYDI